MRNVATELAKERNRAAAERTLTSWIQSSLTLIAFGLGFDRIIAALNKSPASAYAAFDESFTSKISLATISLGVVLLALAAAVHQSEIKEFEGTTGSSRAAAWTLPVSIGAIVLFGVLAAISVFLKAH